MEFDELAKIEKIAMDDPMTGEIMVSVYCITYNHSDYIVKALEGFINQKTNFKYEVVVFDDASTDGTAEIVRDYARKYPDLIRAYLGHRNTYKHPDRKKLITEYRRKILRGKYIAWCEGDDYWIYDGKLQRQFEWMESHPHTTLCIHNAIRYNECTKEVIPQIMDMNTGYIDDEELICCHHGGVPTSSFFYRAELLGALPNSYYMCPVGDDPVRWWCAYNGDVYYMDKVWSVRNYMHAESWNYSMASNIDLKQGYFYCYLEFMAEFDKETNYRFHSHIEQFALIVCRMGIYLKLPDKFTYFELEKRVEELEKDHGEEVRIWYKKILIAQRKRCTDYLDDVYHMANEYRGQFYIYGAGVEAKKCAGMLLDRDICFSGFVVSKKDNPETELLGHAIKEFGELVNGKEACFWLCMNERNREEVINFLFGKGVTKMI